MRVALLAESFLPHVNGVTNSVRRVAEHLQRHGHEAQILAPGVRGTPETYAGFEVIGLPSIPMPGYRGVRITLTPDFLLAPRIAAFAPDVLHLASPLVLGYEAVQASVHLGIPAVAIYQTEVPGYAAKYGFPQLEPLLWKRVRDLHILANRTLAPSTFSMGQLAEHGIPRVYQWGRGVDLDRFHPRHRDDAWRAQVAPNGEVIVGYIGRLAPEKQVENLGALHDVEGIKIVIGGKGPSEPELREALPNATFLGELGGPTLGRIYASLDVFVHPGEYETFGQTLQEAHASGVPVIAPGRGGPIDLVNDGVDGFLYEAGHPEDLRAKVVEILDAPTRERLQAASRPSVEDRSWEAICSQLVDHYRAAIAEGPMTV